MRLPLLAALLCLLLPVVAPAAAGAPEPASASAPEPVSPSAPGALSATDAIQSSQRLQSNSTLPPTNTTLTVHLQADGDATWTVTTVFVLEDENDTRAFDRLASQFESGGADTSFDSAAFERAVERADVDREMGVRNVSYTSTREPSGNVTVGRLTMELEWTNFARAEGDRLIVDDAFNTTAGTWLPGLARNQRLVIVAPPGHLVFDSPRNVGVQQGTISWDGPVDFEPGYLDVTYERTGPTTTTATTTGPGGPGDQAFGPVGAAAIGLGVLGLGAYVLYRRQSDEGTPGGVVDDDEPPAPPAGTEAASTNGSGDAAAEAGSAEAVDLDLLSDEERVEYLLQRNGGRMKQANIVKETGWSNAKVSQLLSEMDDDERVDKLRIGRENLISLPEEDVAEFDEH